MMPGASSARPSTPLRSWGGKRAGAGRPPKGDKAGVSHLRRPALSKQHPVHVTLKLQKGIPNLRTRKLAGVLFRAFAKTAEEHKARVVHFSIQNNHLHLIVEAYGRQALSKAMQGLKIRIAKRLNLKLGNRKGPVFADRYHARALTTAVQVRRAIRYVLNNYRHHLGQSRALAPADWVDSFSSADHGNAFARLPSGRAPCAEFTFDTGPPVTPPRTWLLAVGWRRHGLIRVDELPGSRPG